MTATNFDTVKEKLTEALLSDEVTPSAARKISGMLEELTHESVSEKRLEAMNRELDDIMGNLTGPTVDEIKSKVTSGEVTGKSNRYVPVVFGAGCVGLALFVLYQFNGLWRYVVAGILLVLAWAAIKTGLSASDREIRELTESGRVSEDTKKKFQDRLG